jgi:hypothetical protein
MTEGVTQVIEHLSHKVKTLSANPYTNKKKEN